MTAQDALASLVEFVHQNPTIEVATVARPRRSGELPEARWLPLQTDAEAFFRRVTAAAVLESAADAELRALDLTYKPELNTIEWAELETVEPVRLACERYSNLSELGTFQSGDEDYKKRLLFWVGVRSSGDDRAYFFRAFSAASELRRKRGAALVSRDGPFQIVEETIFLFDESVDCFVHDGYIFVLRKAEYRRIFDQLERVRQEARRAAQRLHGLIPIANLDEFAGACMRQPAMADKLIAVQTRDYFPGLTLQMLEQVIAEFDLQIPIETRDGVRQLVFENGPAARWRILRLVDDDYLRSSMTNHRYEVNSKTTTG